VSPAQPQKPTAATAPGSINAGAAIEPADKDRKTSAQTQHNAAASSTGTVATAGATSNSATAGAAAVGTGEKKKSRFTVKSTMKEDENKVERKATAAQDQTTNSPSAQQVVWSLIPIHAFTILLSTPSPHTGPTSFDGEAAAAV
jgi:hypothetical protein